MLEINQGAEKSIKLKSLKNHCSVCEKEQKNYMTLLSHFSSNLCTFFFFFFPPKSCWSLKWYSYIFALPLCQSNVLNGTFWDCFLLILTVGEFLIPWAILAFAVSMILWFYFFNSKYFFFFFANNQTHKSIKHILYKTQFLPIEDLLMFLEVYFHLDVQWFTPRVSLEYSPLFINCSHVSKGMH